MKGKNLFWSIGGMLVLAGLFTGILLWQQFSDRAEPITEKEAKDIVSEKYPGTIVDMSSANDRYTFTLERKQGVYEVVLNSKNGNILSVKRVAAAEVEKPQEESRATEKPEQVIKEEPVKRLTEEQAIQIALQEVSGQIDDVELKSVDGTSYYFVEVETNDDQEAYVQIHAITGEVKSLTWDD